MRTFTYFALVLVLLAGLTSARAQSGREPGGGRSVLQAKQQLNRAKELLAMNEEERALKLLQNIDRLYPDSPVRYEALMELGKYYVDKKQYSLAIKQFMPITQFDNEAMVAEAMYETGKCYYLLNQYGNAFSYLRRLTTTYPNSVYANQAYYYIGMCHFDQGHWKKSIDALRMVGTAVSQEGDDSRYTEAGQRFMVKIHDKDLVVWAKDGKGITIRISTNRGDEEEMNLSVLDRKGEYYIGSLPTAPGEVAANSGVIEIAGGDIITTSYVDSNTAEGERMVKKTYETRVVSTATAAFTDGAYEGLVKGLFLGQDIFLRVTDLDRDVTNQPDRVSVLLEDRYVQELDDDSAPRTGVTIDDAEVLTRDRLRVELTETGPHTGIFTATLRLSELEQGVTPNEDDEIIHAREKDVLRLTYLDELHIEGDIEEERLYEATVVGGSMGDVAVTVRTLNDFDLKARKNLIEAQALRELAQIFKGVGLQDRAWQKAEEGLDKVQEVVLDRRHISPSLVQEAMRTKWELYLVTDRLREAIATCRELLTLFPSSSLADQAMVKIGTANMEKGEYTTAISIFSGILAMPKSDQQPYAAFHIGVAYEAMAEEQGNQGHMTSAMKAYRHCADKYPTSTYAGQSLEKVANFYLKMKDYDRARELMENVAQDFPDLENMDVMLLKWAVALYRLDRAEEAYAKLVQLLDDYPQSPHAATARKYRDLIGRKLGKG